MHIQTQKQLEDFCQQARQAGCLGFDSEFIPENYYYPELALIQLAIDDACYIVDPLDNLDLSPLEALFHSDEVVVVVHAGAQDMAIFYQRTGMPPKQVFDTQIAAAFLGMGHQVAYASLVQQLFGVSLKKGQSFTNWLKRPLRPEQIQYALEDVAYLVKAYHTMMAALEGEGRLAWAVDEMQHYAAVDFYTAHESHPEKRVKKSGQMRGRDLAVLEAIAQWREAQAQFRNLPRKKILSDYTIVDLAKRKPKTVGELLSLRSADHMAKRYAAELIDVIAEAGIGEIGEKTSKPGVVLSEEQKMLVEYISFCLKAFCTREKLTSAMLSNRSELELMVTDYFSDSFSESRHRLLSGWRRKAVGDDILRCMRGELGVRYDAQEQKLVFFGGTAYETDFGS